MANDRLKNRTAMLELAELLAPGETRVASQMAQVFDDQSAYVDTHAGVLYERNVDTKRPRADLPWVALVITLVRAKRVAPVDWKASPPDVLAALDRLVTRPKKSSRWSSLDAGDRSTLEVLELVGKRVADFELVLGRIDISSDSHELFLAPAGDAKKLGAIAKRASGRLDFFTGRNLAKLERARLAGRKREALRERKNPDAQRQFVHADGRVCITWGESWSVSGKRHYSLDVVWRELGVETRWDAPGNQKRISTQRTDVAKWRKPVIERCLREGYVELALDDFSQRDRAAQKGRGASRRARAHPRPRSSRS